MSFRISRFAILAFTVAALGCGEVRTPVDPVSDAALPTPAIEGSRPAGRIVFGSRALARSKVSAGTYGSGIHRFENTSAILREDEGGELNVKFGKYGDDASVRVEDVSFAVQPNSIGGVDYLWGDRHHIMMEVHSGVRLDEIFIGFQPSGMTFGPVAMLTIHGAGHINADDLVAYHISDDGEVTLPTFTVKTHGNEWVVRIEVPGFSEYSMDEEDEY